MSEETTQETKKRGRKAQAETTEDRYLKTVSFQAPPEVHALMESAGAAYHLDKAGVARLAMRLLVRFAYLGNGQWSQTEELDDELAYAASAAHMGKKLPR